MNEAYVGKLQHRHQRLRPLRPLAICHGGHGRTTLNYTVRSPRNGTMKGGLLVQLAEEFSLASVRQQMP